LKLLKLLTGLGSLYQGKQNGCLTAWDALRKFKKNRLSAGISTVFRIVNIIFIILQNIRFYKYKGVPMSADFLLIKRQKTLLDCINAE
jgi:hypothetical protein